MTSVLLDDILPLVERPSQYLGLELNSVHKDPEDVSLRAVLAFPDHYEVGMSHLGLQILYGLGNDLEGVQVERVFLPQADMLALLKDRGVPLFSLESRTPLSGCDLVGITLQSELTYTNTLELLHAGQIPIAASARGEGHPLVIGGGPCAFNPEPLHEFFDLFLLGDGEDLWVRILSSLRDARVEGQGRTDRLAALKALPGIYDPRDFDLHYASDGRVREIIPKGERVRVEKALHPDLEYELPINSFLVPFLQPVHDRITIEAARGCTRGCRFCHAGSVYRPVRERSPQSLTDLAGDALHGTGYESLSLTALSIGDYGPLDQVLGDLMDRMEKERISLSLPSMRIGGLTPEIARQILRVRRTGFTIAPEAGTRRLRNVVNKDYPDEEILETARWVFDRGWNALKLYFMIGLPTETEKDLDGLVDLVKRLASLAPERGQITVNLSPFVPKAHTPFQWCAQDPEEVLRGKLDYLKAGLRGKKIQVRWSRTDQAFLEAVLARGDRRVAEVVETAWRSGALQDGWDEHFDWGVWVDAFQKCGLDPAWYANRLRGEDEILPWEHISCGVKRDYLLEEFHRGLRGEITEDCREAGCRLCGVCPPEMKTRIPELRPKSSEQASAIPFDDGAREPDRTYRRMRFVFRKAGDMRFLGHLETLRLFERAARRAGVPLAFSGGYHPKPRITLALALPVGVEGLEEWGEMELSGSWSADLFTARMNECLPHGLEILACWKPPLEGQALNVRIKSMEYVARIPLPPGELQEKISKLLARKSIPVDREKKGKVKTVDLKDFLQDIGVDMTGAVRFSLSLDPGGGSARPQEVVGALLSEDSVRQADVRLARTGFSLSVLSDRSAGRPGWSRVWD